MFLERAFAQGNAGLFFAEKFSKQTKMYVSTKP
jgi:hypothetical protein